MLKVIASCDKSSASWNNLQRAVSEKRNVVESARTSNLKRIHSDIQRITKREIEYAQKLVEELVPVKITWNEDAWKRLQDFVPVKVEVVQDQTTSKKDESVKTSSEEQIMD